MILLPSDRINQLLRPFTTTERAVRPETRRVPDGWAGYTRVPTGNLVIGPYTVRHLGLLDQIDQTVTGSTAGQAYHSAYGPKPAGRLDCLAFLQRIEKQSRELAEAYALPLAPLRVRLSALAGVLGLSHEGEVLGWWSAARVLTQHDGPPVSPNTPCPEEDCDRWGTLRVRFDPNVALCVSCNTTWSDDHPDPTHSFGRLAVWIRWASEHLPGPEHVGCTECLGEREGRAERSARRLAHRNR